MRAAAECSASKAVTCSGSSSVKIKEQERMDMEHDGIWICLSVWSPTDGSVWKVVNILEAVVSLERVVHGGQDPEALYLETHFVTSSATSGCKLLQPCPPHQGALCPLTVQSKRQL